MLYKYGVYRQAVQFYKKNNFDKAYGKIAETFRMDDIKRHFNPDNFKPISESSIYFLYQQDKDTLKKMPYENTEDLGNVNFLRSVYELIVTLEKHDEDLQKVKKSIEGLLQQDKLEKHRQSVTISETLEHPVQNYRERMCPLKEQCPSDIRPRWPHSGHKTFSKMGGECPYAHHTYELKFKKEVQSRTQMLHRMLKNVNKRMIEINNIQKPWNPAAGALTDCIGCGAAFEKRGAKGNCKTCQLRKIS